MLRTRREDLAPPHGAAGEAVGLGELPGYRVCHLAAERVAVARGLAVNPAFDSHPQRPASDTGMSRARAASQISRRPGRDPLSGHGRVSPPGELELRSDTTAPSSRLSFCATG
jgi:hypothetical protein